MRNRRTPRSTVLRKLLSPRTDSTRRQQRDGWLAENATAIDAYDSQVAELGVFADTLRAF